MFFLTIYAFTGVTSIDITAIEGLWETNKIFENNGMQVEYIDFNLGYIPLVVCYVNKMINRKKFK